jgi:hypothetical protein
MLLRNWRALLTAVLLSVGIASGAWAGYFQNRKSLLTRGYSLEEATRLDHIAGCVAYLAMGSLILAVVFGLISIRHFHTQKSDSDIA